MSDHAGRDPPRAPYQQPQDEPGKEGHANFDRMGGDVVDMRQSEQRGLKEPNPQVFPCRSSAASCNCITKAHVACLRSATFSEFADIFLTSIEKRFDISVRVAADAIADGSFRGGLHMGTLETGEVGLSPFYGLDALVSDKVKADLERILADNIAGKIQTRPRFSTVGFNAHRAGISCPVFLRSLSRYFDRVYEILLKSV